MKTTTTSLDAHPEIRNPLPQRLRHVLEHDVHGVRGHDAVPEVVVGHRAIELAHLQHEARQLLAVEPKQPAAAELEDWHGWNRMDSIHNTVDCSTEDTKHDVN